jgi:AmiR/NasT family two-component response regulator
MSEPHPLRVLVADEQQRLLEPVAEALTAQGHDVIAHEIEIAAVGRATHEHRPDVAIVVLHEDTRHALDLITEIVDEATCPVVTLAPSADAAFVADAAERGVFAHLDSAEPVELQGGLDVALERYRQYRRLLGAFERRARIERAKGMLMERHGLDDHDAFERIRSSARGSRRRLMDVVDELLASDPS